MAPDKPHKPTHDAVNPDGPCGRDAAVLPGGFGADESGEHAVFAAFADWEGGGCAAAPGEVYCESYAIWQATDGLR